MTDCFAECVSRMPTVLFHPRPASLPLQPDDEPPAVVYEAERSELAVGDLVRVTRNDAAFNLANGDRFTVAAVSPSAVTLTNGARTVKLTAERPLHLDHAYATTIDASQGASAERVLIDAATKSRTTSQEVYYVAISRARREARIYTDDLARLPIAVAREHSKDAALDLEYSRAFEGSAGPLHAGAAPSRSIWDDD